jgi:hypothetical protein
MLMGIHVHDSVSAPLPECGLDVLGTVSISCWVKDRVGLGIGSNATHEAEARLLGLGVPLAITRSVLSSATFRNQSASGEVSA